MTVILLVLFVVIVISAFLYVDNLIKHDTEDMLGRGCNQDCNQGRQCDCHKAQQVRDDFDSDYWPFPTNKKP